MSTQGPFKLTLSTTVVGYMVFEFPAFILIRKYHAPTVYAVSIIIFGLTAIGMAYAQHYWQFMVLRLVLGLGEATVQTAYLYTSLWYRREEMSVRSGYIFSLTPIAGAITGLISYGLQRNMSGVRGLHSWQWLFLIEGVATIGWGCLVWVLLPEMPEKELAKKRSLFFRDPAEKELIIMRSNAAQHVMGAGMDYRQMWLAFIDPKVWMMALIFMTHGVAQNGFAVFLPTFINAFGFEPLVTQLYTMIPYFIAFLSLQGVCWWADVKKIRAIPLFVLTAVGLVGFIILLATPQPVVGIVASCLIVGAVYPAVIVVAGWIPSSSAGYTKRATAVWIAQIVIQSMSIMATQIYDGPPRFFKGHGTVLGLFVLCFGEIALMTWLMKRSNAKKEALAAEWAARGQSNPDESKTLEEMCDAHPNYRYIY